MQVYACMINKNVRIQDPEKDGSVRSQAETSSSNQKNTRKYSKYN